MIRQITIWALLGSGAFVAACSPAQKPAKAIPRSTAQRRAFKVCAPTMKMDRKQLLDLARRYGVIENGEPSIVEILTLNKECLSTSDSEAVDLTKPGCASDNQETCKTGILSVPIR
jgi:hypothetical protein